MKPRSRNCFVTYHHEMEQEYLRTLRDRISEMSVNDHSLKNDIGYYTEDTIYRKIREKMRNCSITIVLVGERSSFRKWIDWEIWTSLRGYTHPEDPRRSFKPNGLLALYLPTRTHAVPARLMDNIRSGYAVSLHWENINDLENKVEEAYHNRMNYPDRISNSRKRQTRNHLHFFGIKI